MTDHRIGLTLYKLDSIMAGGLQPVTDALVEYERQGQREGWESDRRRTVKKT
jgi:peptide chain release factor 1